MNTMMKRDAGRQPVNFGSAIDQIFQNNLSHFFDDSFWGFDGSINRRTPPVNILETDKTYELELIAPGLKKENFNLNIEGETLTISFEQKSERSEEKKQNEKDNGWLRREYDSSAFSRSFNLGDTVDSGKISAKYENGVLSLTLPKKEHAQKISRNIQIQ